MAEVRHGPARLLVADDNKVNRLLLTRSLELQGGVFEPAQAAVFLHQPGARDAVMLRQWDDLAKQADWQTPPLAHFMGRAARCAARPPT